MIEMPKLIDTREVLHPAAFNCGPRITRVDTYEFEGKRTEVRFWTQDGKIVRVD